MKAEGDGAPYPGWMASLGCVYASSNVRLDEGGGRRGALPGLDGFARRRYARLAARAGLRPTLAALPRAYADMEAEGDGAPYPGWMASLGVAALASLRARAFGPRLPSPRVPSLAARARGARVSSPPMDRGPTGSLAARARSIRDALRGARILLASQPNARIHVVATLAVTAAGLALDLPRLEWCALILAIATVWAAEALNTALEFLSDAAVPALHPLVRKAKDVAAGGVLLAALGAALIGALLLIPRLLALCGVL